MMLCWFGCLSALTIQSFTPCVLTQAAAAELDEGEEAGKIRDLQGVKKRMKRQGTTTGKKLKRCKEATAPQKHLANDFLCKRER